MTSLSLATKWRERVRADEGTRAQQVRAVVIALLLSLGVVLATRALAAAPFYASLLWAVLPWWGAATRVARVTVALAFGYAAMMLGVIANQTASPLPFGVVIHPAFGEHPVTLRGGFPWQGIEGCQVQWPLARDCIPFDMGVDALLVNLTVCTVVVWFALRRASPAALLGVAGAAAAVLGVLGGWQLGCMFD